MFFRRFIGALSLDASIFEEIEADRGAWIQSILVLVIASCGGRIAAIEFGVTHSDRFIAGAIVALGGLLVWVSVLAVIGTYALAQPQTRSNVPELLRTLGFATAPGVFLALAAIEPAAPIVVGIVFLWMLAAAVIAVRQALDYTGTGRAIAVCLLGGLLSLGTIAAFVALFGRTVS